MNNQEVYEQGKQAAMREQEQHDYPQAWQMDALMEMRDAWERSAHDETLEDARRQSCAEFAARLDGWLSAWD